MQSENRDSPPKSLSDCGKEVPNSAGKDYPKARVPMNACDCHIHIYDDRSQSGSPNGRIQARGRAEDYRLLQRRIGTSRVVIVTPAPYRTDNRVTLDAIARLGPAHSRGVAVIHPDVTEAELQNMARGGIRGIRFTLWNPATAVTNIGMIEPLSQRIKELGWHVQIHMRADQIADAADLLQRLPSPVVFDHLGRIPQPGAVSHPAFKVICRMIDKGRTWVKLSAPYLDTKVGAPTYADVSEIAKTYLKAAPERLIWGSDWPHPTEKQKPDDALLVDLLAAWASDEKTFERILVKNPAVLYGFGDHLNTNAMDKVISPPP
jgi:D-galactarolactone isomerase